MTYTKTAVKQSKVKKPQAKTVSKGRREGFVSHRKKTTSGHYRTQVSVIGDRSAGTAQEARLASKLVAAVEEADGSDVKRLCENYGLKHADLGRLTGFSLRALADWSAGKLPSEPARRRLHEVRRLLDSLADVVKVETIPKWLTQRNVQFENMTPLQVIEVGEVDRLWQLVYRLGSGTPV
jgi:DNA-binding transcriptional regulator YiaG